MTSNPAAEVIVAAFDKVGDVIAVAIPLALGIYGLIRAGDYALNFLRSTIDRAGKSSAQDDAWASEYNSMSGQEQHDWREESRRFREENGW